MPTVIVGSARDIVEHCAVPRFLFVDFPLGNPAGKPWDAAMQRRILMAGLQLLEEATGPRTTRVADETWGDDAWRARYMEVNAENREALARAGEALRRDRAVRPRREGE